MRQQSFELNAMINILLFNKVFKLLMVILMKSFPKILERYRTFFYFIDRSPIIRWGTFRAIFILT